MPSSTSNSRRGRTITHAAEGELLAAEVIPRGRVGERADAKEKILPEMDGARMERVRSRDDDVRDVHEEDVTAAMDLLDAERRPPRSKKAAASRTTRRTTWRPAAGAGGGQGDRGSALAGEDEDSDDGDCLMSTRRRCRRRASSLARCEQREARELLRSSPAATARASSAEWRSCAEDRAHEERSGGRCAGRSL